MNCILLGTNYITNYQVLWKSLISFTELNLEIPLFSNSVFRDFSDSIVPYILAIYKISQITANGLVYDFLRVYATNLANKKRIENPWGFS